MSTKAPGARPRGAGEGGQRMDNDVWSQTVKLSWFESQGALPALAF